MGLEWLDDASHANDIEDLFSALSVSSLLLYFLLPTIVLLLILSFIFYIRKKIKAKKKQQVKQKNTREKQQMANRKQQGSNIRLGVDSAEVVESLKFEGNTVQLNKNSTYRKGD